MATNTPIVDAGDYIEIPCHTKADASGLVKRHKIRWHQYFQTHNETYDRVLVKNTTKNTEVCMFIQAQWYRIYDADEDSELPKEHLSKVAQLNDDGSYKLRVDYRLQYGQENLEGKGRYLVYHDPNRIPYQNRFVPPPKVDPGILLTIIASFAPPKLLELFGKVKNILPGILASYGGGDRNYDYVIEDIRNLVGDGLHTFRFAGTQTGSH